MSLGNFFTKFQKNYSLKNIWILKNLGLIYNSIRILTFIITTINLIISFIFIKNNTTSNTNYINNLIFLANFKLFLLILLMYY